MVCMTEGSKSSSINPVWLLCLLLKSKSCFLSVTGNSTSGTIKHGIQNGVSVEVKENIKGTVELRLCRPGNVLLCDS